MRNWGIGIFQLPGEEKAYLENILMLMLGITCGWAS